MSTENKVFFALALVLSIVLIILCFGNFNENLTNIVKTNFSVNLEKGILCITICIPFILSLFSLLFLYWRWNSPRTVPKKWLYWIFFVSTLIMSFIIIFMIIFSSMQADFIEQIFKGNIGFFIAFGLPFAVVFILPFTVLWFGGLTGIIRIFFASLVHYPYRKK